jgi:hypothetical protein
MARRRLHELLVNDHGIGSTTGSGSCCKTVDALDRYEAGEISQDDFPGHDVEVKISVEKRPGFSDHNRIDEYRVASASSVVNLRSAG